MNGSKKNVRSIAMVPIFRILSTYGISSPVNTLYEVRIYRRCLFFVNMVESLGNTAGRWVLFPSWDVLASLPRQCAVHEQPYVCLKFARRRR